MDPNFFRRPPPPGRSRESTIRLDAEGHFFHDGERVEHRGLEAAMHGWIARHPDDGRFILTNGYDWTYVTVDDAPYLVRALRPTAAGLVLRLDDGTEELWDPGASEVRGVHVYTRVKADRTPGVFEARFDRHAQHALGPFLEEVSGGFAVRTPHGLVGLRTAQPP